MRILFNTCLLCITTLLIPRVVHAQYETFITKEKILEETNQIDSLNRILRLHHNEAISRKDTLEQIKVLKWIYWFNENNSELVSIENNLLSITKAYGDENLMSEVYYAFASKNFENGEFEPALSHLRSSYTIAIDLDQFSQALEAIRAYNSLVLASSNFEQALNELNYFKKIVISDKSLLEEEKAKLTLEVELEKAIIFLNSNQIDSSAILFNTILKKEALLNKNTLGRFKLFESTLNYRLDYFLKSRDTILKYLNLFSPSQKKDGLYTLSLIEDKLGNKEKSISLLSTIDSILEKEGYPFYGNAISTYRKLVSVSKDSTREKYLGLLYYYENSNLSINEDLVSKEVSIKRHLLWLVIVISILAIVFVFRFSQKKNKKEYSNKSSESSSIEFKFVSDLKRWEDKREYLSPEITLSSLAASLGSNTSYLSKYFNQELGISFSTYLGKMRINHLLTILKTNPEFVSKKSSIQIAESLGFKSIDAYTRAFKLTTGKTPSQYIKSLLNSDSN